MLSKRTKYGIKALTFIAKQELGKPVQVPFIAKEENISIKFLESILLALKKGGVLSSRKGKGGGYYLRANPQEIKLSAIMRILEGPIAMVPCVSLNFYERCNDCEDETACSVHELMREVRDANLAVYDTKTLQDILV